MNSGLPCLQQGSSQCWQQLALVHPQTQVSPSLQRDRSLSASNVAMSDWWVLGVFLLIVASIGGYRRYRTMTRRKQIQTLERLWRLH